MEISKALLSYCSVNGYLPYLGSPRKRDLLPEKEQLRKIALAQQKRERKSFKEKQRELTSLPLHLTNQINIMINQIISPYLLTYNLIIKPIN